MKHIRLILIAAALMVAAVPVRAQLFRYGVSAGININSMHFSKDILDSHSRTGYTFGVKGELNLPILPFSVDASLMFSHRSYNMSYVDTDSKIQSQTKGANYFEIPLSVRWSLSIPAISAIVKPYLFTGPNFAFLLGGKKVNDLFSRSNRDVHWNFGFGAEFVRHLQLSAAYAIGMSRAYKGEEYGSGKSRYWTVTATYLF